jgi:hypothetical protein
MWYENTLRQQRYLPRATVGPAVATKIDREGGEARRSKPVGYVLVAAAALETSVRYHDHSRRVIDGEPASPVQRHPASSEYLSLAEPPRVDERRIR